MPDDDINDRIVRATYASLRTVKLYQLLNAFETDRTTAIASGIATEEMLRLCDGRIAIIRELLADRSVDPHHPALADCVVNECEECSARDCPYGEPLHYHHDGCPRCGFE